VIVEVMELVSVSNGWEVKKNKTNNKKVSNFVKF